MPYHFLRFKMSWLVICILCGARLTLCEDNSVPPSTDSIDSTTRNPNNQDLSTEENHKNITPLVDKSPSVTTNSGSGANNSGPYLTSSQSSTTSVPRTDAITTKTTSQTSPVPVYDRKWMDYFITAHHFSGQYNFKEKTYTFDFIVQYRHPVNPNVLVATFYDEEDGARFDLNGTSVNGVDIVFAMSLMYTPGDLRFPLFTQFEMKGRIVNYKEGSYFSGNVTKPVNASFGWIQMTKGLGTVETGETAGMRTAIIIIIPTCIACIGVCATVAIICWAVKKGFLRGRHKEYRLFSNTLVAYETEAETIHI
ncbi:uncharacterized protein LOC127833724 [Dreissena polymorpha]|uniref:uncharacterized protein LOC127833724 n=1 Tax=Dreissena polymorpha TaxID=45954 RepID=UPI002264327F|nr:uncharacterized protein LOC127833724 [Dreissena polymorpha]